MKSSRLLLPTVALLLLLAIYWSARDPVSAQDKPREGAAKWEYKVIPLGGDPKELEKTLNELGDDGWEVSGATGKYTGNLTTEKGIITLGAEVNVIICKRPKRWAADRTALRPTASCA
jgi:hypothetical protein